MNVDSYVESYAVETVAMPSDMECHRESWFNLKGPKAPIAWYGGKQAQAEWIISQMPDHEWYAEPFGGMANVLLKKHPAMAEIFNDMDDRIVNFFRVLRNREQFEELKHRCLLTPNSRQQFRELCETAPPTDPVEKAWQFFVLARQARGGFGAGNVTPSSWAASCRLRREMPEQVSKYLSAIDGLEDVAARLSRVVIEQLPAVDFITKYDKPERLLYCDPPYPGRTRHGGKAGTYAVEMTDEEHVELLTIVRKCSARILISSYPSDMYDHMLAGWTRIEKPMKAQAANSGEARTEVLWKNF